MDVDYRLAFDLAPVGLVLSRNRTMVDCNRHVCRNVWRVARGVVMGQSFQILYPSADEYERLARAMAPILNAKGHYADNRVMKRANGGLFWCHVSGRALDRDDPHASGIWSFEDLSSQRPSARRTHRARTRGGRAPARRPDLQGNRQGPGDQPPHGRRLPAPASCASTTLPRRQTWCTSCWRGGKHRQRWLLGPVDHLGG